VRARPLIIEGHNEGWVLALNNVTDARHTLTAMRHQERLASVGQLAAGMAHDFNNILAVISLYVEVSLSEIYHSPALRQRLKIINDQTEKAANLIQQILDFGRSSMLQPQPIDFSTLLTNQISLLQRTLPENITIDATYDLGQLIIEADPTRMQQVIMNLAINARNAMPNGGNLHFSLTEFQVDAYYTPHKAVDLPHGLWIALEVKDTGIGIAPEIIDRIFEPFFTTLEPGQGSGLGLAQVYGIVKQHGGDIHVDSSPGQGTVFTIYLPATESDESADEIHPDAIPRGHQERVLIVEDDEMVRIVLDESLTTLNYEVITAVNGQEALRLYQQQDNPIDLVLSDMIMPEMNGDVLFFELKKLDTAVKMVIITGYAQAERLTEMQHQGLKGWLYKPPNLEELATLVANALA
jgi:nitrogen-specific signal transduction histidine kinase/CheY-like chemotaxis protein